MEVTEMNIYDIRNSLRRVMYSLSVIAFHEVGENRRDILKIRDEIKSLLKKKANKKDIINELGFIIIGLSILIESINDSFTKDKLKEVLDELA
ncbi:hypothetical protein DFR86_10625 [Acidianus sulfidivorans JP7]|uniref:Uncharacterized protein n=1 Tax=Acidianus sulfidivorans JP7 TaxID=619593 RepID=A0A2U9IPL5_9CREN|nr:hypothetical protein [Acidianus sulfidivorans]AWR97943.1 hypothetical protein DFR86_10625 [Acidianus sulfidivorans JP7]